jgi:hypothetical protein
MIKIVIACALVTGIVVTGGCSKKQLETTQTPSGEVAAEAVSPNDSPATVTMADGSRYHGALIAKNGSQMTFRGDNGTARTLDARDIQSISFGDVGAAHTGSKMPSRSEEFQGARAPLSSVNTALESVRSKAIIPSGTRISVRNNEAINSKTASAGQTFSAVINSDVVDNNGEVAIPRGSAATLVVRQSGAGRIHANDLALELSSIAIRGVSYKVQTGIHFQKGKDGVGANKRTAIFSGGGAAVGALIGGLVGGGKGAAIGAASGAGAGAGTQILTRGSVKIPSESLMSFSLQAPLVL